MINMKEPYDFNESLNRISKILSTPNQTENIGMVVPTEESIKTVRQMRLYCTVMTIRVIYNEDNINDSIWMRNFEAYLYEITVLLRSCQVCKDFNMFGDDIVAIFETPFRKDILQVVDTMSRIHTLRMVIENRLKISQGSFQVYMGMHFGKCEAFYIGDQLGDQPSIAWRGEAISITRDLLKIESQKNYLMAITSTLYNNLSDEYQKLFHKSSYGSETVYLSNMRNVQMNKWLIEHS